FTLLLCSTSFVVFEDWLVRFVLTIIYTMKFLQKKNYNYLIAAIITRCSFIFGVCREEQFPYCQVLSHRTISPSLPLLALISAAVLFATKEKKNLALVAWWTWTW